MVLLRKRIVVTKSKEEEEEEEKDLCYNKLTTRFMSPTKHQKVSASFSITASIGERRSLIPCTYPDVEGGNKDERERSGCEDGRDSQRAERRTTAEQRNRKDRRERE